DSPSPSPRTAGAPSESSAAEDRPDPFIEALEGGGSGKPFKSPERAHPAAATDADESARIQELASKFSGQAAELSPKGDLVHYVTYPGETLSNIARWYTFERDNAARIARINDLKNPDQLSPGDTIVIPAYMLKNKVRLSEQALKELQTIAARH
ncbi:MAG: hypothetical protein DCC75_05645, partial [Proteobacteria bacterium]